MPSSSPRRSSSNDRHPSPRRQLVVATGLVICAVVFGTRALRIGIPRRADASTAPSRGRVPATSPVPVGPDIASGSIGTRAASGAVDVAPDLLPGAAGVAAVRTARGTRQTRETVVAAASLDGAPAYVGVLSETAVGTLSEWQGPVARRATASTAQAETGREPTGIGGVGGVGRGGPARMAMDWRALAAIPGLSFAAEEITDASSGTAAFAGATSLRTHSDLQVTVDFDSMAGVPGLTMFAQHKTKTGRNGSAPFIQSVSNIDADDFRAFGEVWVEQRLLGDRVRVKAGRIDFNSEFAGTDHGAAFLNASMGYSPSIAAAPTFPLPTSGINLFLSPSTSTTVAVGVFNGLDGAPAPTNGSSRFQIAQVSQQWSLGTDLPGRVGVGAWRHTGLFLASQADPESEPDVPGTHGWFSTLDQRLWQGAPRGADAERAAISAFAQFGIADQRVQTIHAHNGGGLTFAGLSAHRPGDVIGVGVTRASWREGSELITEVFYQLPVISHLSLVADFQRIARRDGGLPGQFGNVTTLRTIVSF